MAQVHSVEAALFQAVTRECSSRSIIERAEASLAPCAHKPSGPDLSLHFHNCAKILSGIYSCQWKI